jgi:thioredoxin reductase (NADPH)
LYKGQIEMDDRNFIKVDSKMQTSVPGVFASGEAADAEFKQVVISAGMGAAAAIQAGRFLAE